jgi:hypothetical protein
MLFPSNCGVIKLTRLIQMHKTAQKNNIKPKTTSSDMKKYVPYLWETRNHDYYIQSNLIS